MIRFRNIAPSILFSPPLAPISISVVGVRLGLLIHFKKLFKGGEGKLGGGGIRGEGGGMVGGGGGMWGGGLRGIIGEDISNLPLALEVRAQLS